VKLRRVALAAAVLFSWSCAGDVDQGTGNGGNGGSSSAGTGGTTGGAGNGGTTGQGGTGGNVATGTAGTTGAAGAAGTTGAAGAGATGVAGTTGAAGAAGTTGAAGSAGGTTGGRGGAAGSAAAGRGGNAGSTAGAGGTAGAAGSSAGRGGAAGSAAGTGGTAGTTGTCGTPAAVMFTPNVRLNDDTGSGRQAEVALATGPNGLALAGWMDERSTRVCAFSFSTNGGMTWSKNVSIPNMSGVFVGDPSVAIDGGGTLYAICQEYTKSDGSAGNIRMMTSSDKGVTWSAIRTIQSAPDKPWGGGGNTDGVVFVSWLGNPGGIKRSTDHGMTWGPTQSLGNIIHGTGITTSNTGLVHVPYNLDSQRNQLRYLRSKNNGDSWEATRDLVADMGTFCFSCNPRQHPIVGSAADPTGRTVAITWASQMPGGEGDDDVWLLYSKDGGDTWTQPIRVNDNATKSRQFESWVAVDSCGRVHVAWTDYRDGGNNETWYARSADPTKGFEKNIQVTDGHGSGNTDFLGDYKGIAVSGPDVLVVWEDTRRDSGDIYFSRAPGAAGP